MIRGKEKSAGVQLLLAEKITKRPGLAWCLALGLLMLICLLNYCYVDLQIIVRHSINMWDLLAEGRILEFYRTGSQLEIGLTNPTAGEVPYDFLVYIPIAVWNLPVYFWEKLTGLTFETNFLALLWIRLGTMVPLVASNRAIWGIGGTLKKDEAVKGWSCYLFSGSMFLLAGLFCLGQIDIFGTFFLLMGLWAYLRKDKKKFLIWFALAISCKMIALFVFIPLLLLEEKRILYVLRSLLAGLSLSLLSKILFFADKMATPTQFDERRFIRFLFERRIDLSEVTVSVFALLFLALVIWCWVKKCEEGNREKTAIWVAYAGYSCFFFGAVTFPYWAVVYSPFLALFVLLYPGKAKLLIWLETAAGAVYFLDGICNWGFIYSGKTNIRWMLAGIWNGRAMEGMTLYDLFESLSPGAQQNTRALLWSVFAVAVGAILWLTWPSKRQQEKEPGLAVDYGTMTARLGLHALLALLPLLYYMIAL